MIRHYLIPTPRGGARWDAPELVSRILCTVEPGEKVRPLGTGTHDAAEVTCRECRRHPAFPELPPYRYVVMCAGGCGRSREIATPRDRRGRRRRIWLCGRAKCALELGRWQRQRKKERAAELIPCDGCGFDYPRAEFEVRPEVIAGRMTVLRFCRDCAKLEDALALEVAP